MSTLSTNSPDFSRAAQLGLQFAQQQHSLVQRRAEAEAVQAQQQQRIEQTAQSLAMRELQYKRMLEQDELKQQASQQKAQQQAFEAEQRASYFRDHDIDPRAEHVGAGGRTALLNQQLESQGRLREQEATAKRLEAIDIHIANLPEKSPERKDLERVRKALQSQVISLETGIPINTILKEQASDDPLKNLLKTAGLEGATTEAFARFDSSASKGASNIEGVNQDENFFGSGPVDGIGGGSKEAVARAQTDPTVVELVQAGRAARKEIISKTGEDPGDIIAKAVEAVDSKGSTKTGIERLREVKAEAERLYLELLGKEQPRVTQPTPQTQENTLDAEIARLTQQGS